jgi:acetoin utilization protein AcuB
MRPSLLVIDAFTTPSPVTVLGETKLTEIVALMNAHDIRHVPVVDVVQRVLGIISQRDVNVFASVGDIDDVTASDIMTPNPYTVPAGTPLLEVASHMAGHKLGSAIVLDSSGKVEGIFTTTDACHALVKILEGYVWSDKSPRMPEVGEQFEPPA